MNTLEFVMNAFAALFLIFAIGAAVNILWPVAWSGAEKPSEAPTALTPSQHTGGHE